MKKSNVPKYFATAHIICLLIICAVNSFDFFFGPFKNNDAFMMMNYFQICCWLFVLPALFICEIVVLIVFRKSKKRHILSNLLAMLLNIITWLFVVAAFAVKF